MNIHSEHCKNSAATDSLAGTAIYMYVRTYVYGYVSMQKAVWCLCFYGKNLLISGSGDQCIKVCIW